MNDLNTRIGNLEEKYSEILSLLKELSALIGEKVRIEAHAAGRRKINAKAIIKQGMTAYYSGAVDNPFTAGTDENEFWQFGYDNARDTWDEIRK
jgi:hypothetical protein